MSGIVASGKTRMTLTSLRHVVLLLVLSGCSFSAMGQGCTQCRDNAAATPPKTQAAYRHATTLMLGAAGGLFLGVLVVFQKNR